MRRKIIVLGLLIRLFTIGVSAEVLHEEAYPIQAAITPQRRTYTAGTPILLDLIITNTSDDIAFYLDINENEDYAYSYVDLRISSATGEVSAIHAVYDVWADISDIRILKPAEVVKMPLGDVTAKDSFRYWCLPSGSYTVSGIFHNQALSPDKSLVRQSITCASASFVVEDTRELGGPCFPAQWHRLFALFLGIMVVILLFAGIRRYIRDPEAKER